jgi:hypothetical protein
MTLNRITATILLRLVVDHQVPAVFVVFLAMRKKIRYANTHSQLQNDLVEHL